MSKPPASSPRSTTSALSPPECRSPHASVQQGHGVIVALSSVAGERPRRSNFVYGSTKAGMDAFYTGLGEALRDVGGRVLVVRPGFVASKMTEGLDPAPLATTPDAVADAVVDGRAQWQGADLGARLDASRHVRASAPAPARLSPSTGLGPVDGASGLLPRWRSRAPTRPPPRRRPSSIGPAERSATALRRESQRRAAPAWRGSVPCRSPRLPARLLPVPRCRPRRARCPAAASLGTDSGNAEARATAAARGSSPAITVPATLSSSLVTVVRSKNRPAGSMTVRSSFQLGAR